ncbi:MAG TPA: UDP-N-acetylmuramoyl-L-alanyl-D-glutamate--2,6-diaminopimelate ligase [Thermoanaerobaculia bacterium]|nr:UDP-N-acetylmuramoyl-L-alanyl-D-glutamate--2,6-diaminopimelate ligase [Thermoanaerobaculia bacterium]
MKLSELSRGVDRRSAAGNEEVEIASVTADSRMVMPGSLFVAVPGLIRDGMSYVDAARKRGAVAIVAEQPLDAGGGAFIEVPDARAALSELASAFYSHPSRKLSIVGVTGTSGKTTTTLMLESLFDATGEPVGLIGTIEYRAGSVREVADRTTPDAVVLQSWFARMVDAGVNHVAMEVSSHALALKRTFGIRFSAAVFTNLSRDHFDFHRDFDDYFSAKAILFDQIDRTRRSAVINEDDEWGAKLVARVGRDSVLTYGRSERADVRPAAGFRVSAAGLHGSVITPLGELKMDSPLLGVPNLYNWLAAIGGAITVGIPLETIERGIAKLGSVRGRFERIAHEGGPLVIVDYAHKPDALEKLLHAVRELSPGQKIVLVFGCGGERDEGKRPLMGEIAGRLADFTVITSDNPRGEEPSGIIGQIEAGVRKIGDAKYSVVPDRREAIEQAILSAGEGDVVLIAGKGHENYQVIADRILHFDDREEAEAVLKNRKASGKGL